MSTAPSSVPASLPRTPEEDEDDGTIPMADEGEDADIVGEDDPATPTGPRGVEGGDGPESLTSINILDGDDLTNEEQEEKARLIAQVS